MEKGFQFGMIYSDASQAKRGKNGQNQRNRITNGGKDSGQQDTGADADGVSKFCFQFWMSPFLSDGIETVSFG